MNELNEGLQDAMHGKILDDIRCIETKLRETAGKWASYCLNEFDGDTLTKGLLISKALAEFLNEFEEEEQVLGRKDR